MEDLWRLRKIGYRSLSDMADRAEYDRMIRRFHEEEQMSNMNNLLYGEEHIDPPIPPFVKMRKE